MKQLSELADKIVRTADQVRSSGAIPDELNRWLTMTPEKLAEDMERPRTHNINDRRFTAMPPAPGPKESALRDMRTEQDKDRASRRIAKLKASVERKKREASGEAAAMPAQGREALAKIASEALDRSSRPRKIEPSATEPAMPDEPQEKTTMETTTVHVNDVHKIKHPAAKANRESWPAGKSKAKAAKAKAAKAKKAPAKPEKAGDRSDGLKPGSKLAKMLDAAVAAGKDGITEEALCKKIGGWKACAVTLRRVCERVGAKCAKVGGKFVVTLK
jgi:hypothetical protein